VTATGPRVRVLAVVPAVHDRSPGQRYRIEQWEPFLAGAGVDVEYVPFESARLHDLLYAPGNAGAKALEVAAALCRRILHVVRARRCDAVFVYREAALLGPAFFERLLAMTGTPIVYDFDDAIFVPYVSPTNPGMGRLKSPGKTASICRLAACVTVGNQYLAEYARRWNGRVEVVPTTIDLSRYTLAAPAPHPRPVIGWTGTHSTYQHLDRLQPALAELAADHDFVLRVIGPADYRMEGVDVENRRWNSESEVDDLRGIDIGVMPLPDDPWSRGKCGAKALQYMGLAIPAVCSPVGVNVEIVAHGVNGLLAAGDDEWVAGLAGLLDSEADRRRLGLAGRATVDERFSAQVHGPRMAAILRSVAGVGPS
jgi:glycosyltransferase involved in cell wall biosynthesis